MLTEERFAEILKIVEEKKTVTVAELTALLRTSESTIRRALMQLDKRGKLKKVHGGATVLELSFATTDPEIELRYNWNRNEKVAIAKYASMLIEPHDFVFIDAGTTTELVADYIIERNATYVTNSMEHGRKLVHKGCKTYILGGELKAVTEATVGAETIEELNRFNFTKGFFGVNGINLKLGFTTPEISEAMVKMKALKNCFNPYILSDSSKFGKISSVSFGKFKDAIIITTAVKYDEFKKCKNIIEVSFD